MFLRPSRKSQISLMSKKIYLELDFGEVYEKYLYRQSNEDWRQRESYTVVSTT